MPDGSQQRELGQLLLTEVFTMALGREYPCALYDPLPGAEHSYVLNLLRRQGFVPAPVSGRPVLEVDMRCPIVLSHNVDTSIKAPLASMPRVTAAVSAAHRRLQEALTELQPGSLVLSLSAGIIYHRLLQRITARNGVPAEPVAGTGYLRPLWKAAAGRGGA